MAKNSFGGELWLAPAGETLVKVAELDSLDPPVLSRDALDATSHESAGGAMEFIPSGVYDPGEINFGGFYLSNSVNDLAITTAVATGLLQDFKLVEKGVTVDRQKTGKAIVTKWGPESFAVNGLQKFTGSLKATGEITNSVAV